MSQYKVKTVHHPLNCTVEVPGSPEYHKQGTVNGGAFRWGVYAS